MINFIHSRLHRPERGWDPISQEYAQHYAQNVASVDQALVARFSEFCGGFAGKRVADVGSGPGQYALEFARRGAAVTCIDISRNYLAIAAAQLEAEGFAATCQCCYIDEISADTGGAFDAIFSNVAWYYCMSDRQFARRLWGALKVGGVIGVRASNSSYEPHRSLRRRLVYFLNDRARWKIGHPHPPHGRIAAELGCLGPCEVRVDYSDPKHDVIFVRRLG